MSFSPSHSFSFFSPTFFLDFITTPNSKKQHIQQWRVSVLLSHRMCLVCHHCTVLRSSRWVLLPPNRASLLHAMPRTNSKPHTAAPVHPQSSERFSQAFRTRLTRLCPWNPPGSANFRSYTLEFYAPDATKSTPSRTMPSVPNGPCQNPRGGVMRVGVPMLTRCPFRNPSHFDHRQGSRF